MPELLYMENIWKSFFGVPVLKNISFHLHHGEVHVLLGENGAGKSTLIKILSGAYTLDSGKIFLEGQDQVNLVNNIAATKPAGILLAATDAKALQAPVENAIKSGVPVIMVDSGIEDPSIPLANITTDNFDGGYKAGMLLAEMIGKKGKVSNIGITAGSQTGRERSDGFIEAMKNFPDIQVLPVQWTNAEAATAMNIATDQLNANPDIVGFYSAAAPMAVGIAQALKAKGLDKKVKLITFDPSPEVLPLFEEGTIQAILAQDPYQMGYRGVEMLDRVIKGGTIAPEEKNIQIPVVIITPENYNQPEIQKLLQTPDKF